jgi:Flp pilus assembly protein TadB
VVTLALALTVAPLVMALLVVRTPVNVSRKRLHRLVVAGPATRHPARQASSLRGIDTARWASVLAAFTLGMVVRLPAGVVVGVVVGVLLDRWLHRLPRREEAVRAERREADTPLAADLLAAALLSGATPDVALLVVGEALSESIGPELVQVARAFGSGASADEAWAVAPTDLDGLAEVFRRSAASGTPAAPALVTFADQCRSVRRTRLRERAGRVGVRSAMPLSICFLPAFLLLGVVPVVAGLVRTLLR